MIRKVGAGLLLLMVAGLGACAPGQRSPTVEGPVPSGHRALVDDVPFYAQTTGHCGPSALAMVLAWSGAPVTPTDLIPVVFTPGRGGSLAQDVAGGARAHARLAVPVGGLDATLREVAAGHPVLVLQNLGLSWWPQWHYAVLTGFDFQEATVRLHSGAEADRVISLGVFRRTFERGGARGLVVLPPGRLPITADEHDVLTAAAGLERAGRPAAAARTYAAALERWPESPGAAIGLANARLAQGDVAAAARVLEAASRHHPRNASVWNNLAHVRLLRGELLAAEAAAGTALALGGPATRTARLTLEEIRTARAAAG